MTSVEGMWSFQSGSYDDPAKVIFGGIVILESGRVFGGDLVQAYLGSYAVDRTVMRADIRSWTWNTEAADGETVFGIPVPNDYNVVLEGAISEGLIKGVLYPVDAPDLRLAAIMKKISELP